MSNFKIDHTQFSKDLPKWMYWDYSTQIPWVWIIPERYSETNFGSLIIRETILKGFIILGDSR